MISNPIKENGLIKITYDNIYSSNNNTTVIINNINRNLRSGDINVILSEKILYKAGTYNAIYTPRKKDKFKNIGICYVNFIHQKYILQLLDKLKDKNYFKKKDDLNEIFWAEIQGDEFIKKMSENWEKDKSLDFIQFSNVNIEESNGTIDTNNTDNLINSNN